MSFARRHLWIAVLSALIVIPGCYTSESARLPERRSATEHYREFERPGDLADYLRLDSEAGPLVSAHRGGPVPGYPENAIPTFEHSLRYGPVLVEADVRMTRDSTLVLMHDETLERTTTGEGLVRETSLADLRQLRLVDAIGRTTSYRVPTLAEALAWAEGRAILTLDVKRGVPPELVVDELYRHDAMDQAVVITYSLDDALHYRDLAPDLVLSASAETVTEANALLEQIDPFWLIVFTGVGTLRPDVVETLHAANVRAMLGTFGEIDDRALRRGHQVYVDLIEQGVDVVATDVVPLATRAAQAFEAVEVAP